MSYLCTETDLKGNGLAFYNDKTQLSLLFEPVLS
jgi:hypothetical protein